MKLGILTSGGDAPGMNAAIRSAAVCAIARGVDVLGIRRGYEGLLARDVAPLRLRDLDGISRYGGTLLGSARSSIFPTEAGQLAAVESLRALEVDRLLVIGGNGSLAGAHALASRGACRVVGLPASIDNDLGHTRTCIGVDTALNTIVEATDRISDTARAHRRVFVVEVMGRLSGYLAMRSGIAADADAILFPERHRSRADIEATLVPMLERAFTAGRDKQRILVIKAEGVPMSSGEVAAMLREHVPTGVDVRETVLGHVVRGGSPSAQDRTVAQRLAVAGVLALEDPRAPEGPGGAMCGWETSAGIATRDPSVRLVPLAEVLTETAAMAAGTSPAILGRVALLEMAESLLAL